MALYFSFVSHQMLFNTRGEGTCPSPRFKYGNFPNPKVSYHNAANRSQFHVKSQMLIHNWVLNGNFTISI